MRPSKLVLMTFYAWPLTDLEDVHLINLAIIVINRRLQTFGCVNRVLPNILRKLARSQYVPIRLAGKAVEKCGGFLQIQGSFW